MVLYLTSHTGIFIMSQSRTKTVYWFSICLLVLEGCNARKVSPVEALVINLLYPTPSTQVEMGQTIKSVIKVTDTEGQAVENAEVVLTFSDPNGAVKGTTS